MSTAHMEHTLHPDPAQSAQDAGLVYVSHDAAGIVRRGTQHGFEYVRPDGTLVADEDTLARIRALAVPPAYTDVWICTKANGHVQATGKDARGRTQFRYHARWREVRDAAKYGRTAEFIRALPRIREQVDRDLRRHGMPKEKAVAAVVRLLEETHIRVGNEEYARENGSYGLTTLHAEHVDVDGSVLHFHFRGKSGKDHKVDLRDARVAKVVRRCAELPGDELFEWTDGAGHVHSVGSGDVNDYLRAASDADFTAKDYRTWAGTTLAARALSQCPACDTKSAVQKTIVGVIKDVARELGNTPAVCRKCYVHPAILTAYETGGLRAALDGTHGVAEEAALLALLTVAESAGIAEKK